MHFESPIWIDMILVGHMKWSKGHTICRRVDMYLGQARPDFA